ncbi:hypothetical protein [Reyranella soli]|uniref:Uncharacterized protein n=1 Tax=Reyranella soli TaxID=1230389 RepID=A0A512NRU2_9HYPH|nr:hypothetical protein [Reyranella soli]GEP61657.1 hypothetical protein RSO01_88230 [Reyranella soli]
MQFLISALSGLVLVAVATAIVYQRNKGKLSVGKSYLKGLLHLFRVMGWMFMVWGVLFVPVVVTDLIGFSHWGYPWWSIFFVFAFVALGYALQRLMKYIPRDPDWNNMFASKKE